MASDQANTAAPLTEEEEKRFRDTSEVKESCLEAEKLGFERAPMMKQVLHEDRIWATLDEVRNRFYALKRVLQKRCPYHFGEDGDDWPEVTHQFYGKHGWERIKCELTEEERRLIGELDGKG